MIPLTGLPVGKMRNVRDGIINRRIFRYSRPLSGNGMQTQGGKARIIHKTPLCCLFSGDNVPVFSLEINIMLKNLTDENEIKVFILYILKSIGYPIPYDDIMDIVYNNGYTGYFDFVMLFESLLKNGDIKKTGEDLYEISERGIVIADNLNTLLPQYARSRGYASVVKYLDFNKKGIEFKHDSGEKDGKYYFSCYITENGGEIFSLNLQLEEKSVMEKIVKTYGERPDSVYKGILAMLSGEVDFIF